MFNLYSANPNQRPAVSLKDQTTLRVVLYEDGQAAPLEAGQRLGTMTALLEKGFAVTRVTGDGKVAPAERNSLLVLGRFMDEKLLQPEEANSSEHLRFKDIS